MECITIKNYFEGVIRPIGVAPNYAPFTTDGFMESLQDYIKITNGCLKIRPSITIEVDGLSELRTLISNICGNIYITNRYKYETLYESINFEYNPIENYNMEETESIDTSGNIQESSVVGSQTNSKTESNTTNYGATVNSTSTNHSTTNVVGEVVTTNNKTENVVDEHGEQSEISETNANDVVGERTNTTTKNDTNVFGAITTTTSASRSGSSSGSVIESTSAYDDSAWSNLSKKESNDERDESDSGTNTEGEHTNTVNSVNVDNIGEEVNTKEEKIESSKSGYVDESTSTVTDNNVVQSHTDTSTSSVTNNDNLGAHSDEYSSNISDVIGGRTDTHSNVNNSDTDRTLTRKGNIGTTTTQLMLLQEREVAMFNLYSVIASDIVSSIALRIY